jgi:glycyl-tRNA synthetase beta chain
MAELFLELFSEEIPARMQAGAADDLARLLSAALGPLEPEHVETFYGARRIALRADVASEIAAATTLERGPRVTAPEQALAGFLRKHDATRDQLREEAGYWVLHKTAAATLAATLIAQALPPLLRRFPWPKSMRWGGTSQFTWVRPLRRIVCLLDGEVVPFDLRDGDDDGHGLASSDLTEGHRFHAPGAFRVSGCGDWRDQLAARRVLVDAEERRRRIAGGIAALAEARALIVVDDPGLLDEVAGLVEWPVPLLGRIDPSFMDLPPEVMQVSMRMNQRYFALRTASGAAAPWFGFVANIEAEDGGAVIIAGNERVLRARFADARHFWDLDRKTPLAARVPALEDVMFHARLGSQGERVRRLRRLARVIAPLVGADPKLTERAAELAKADLVTGMVGEFPELQGVMGSYYARHDREPPEVAKAVRDHYAPKGPTDPVPSTPVTIAVALADKLDQLAGFFAIGEKPTGSGDPYALRRAALGAIRIILSNQLRLSLGPFLDEAVAHARQSQLEASQVRPSGGFGAIRAQGLLIQRKPLSEGGRPIDLAAIEVIEFLKERLQIQLRAEGARHDVLAAVFAAGADDDIVRLLARTEAVTNLLGTEDGANLLTAYKRAANILRIEERRDGPHSGPPDRGLLRQPEEWALAEAIDALGEADRLLAQEDYPAAMALMARLRGPLDAFFDRVTVNAPEPDLRRNRLRLLSRVRAAMDRVADFSKIEG